MPGKGYVMSGIEIDIKMKDFRKSHPSMEEMLELKDLHIQE